MDKDLLRGILMTIYLLLKERYEKMGDMFNGVVVEKENALEIGELVLHILSSIDELNTSRRAFVDFLKGMDDDKGIRFEPDSQYALTFVMALRELNNSLTKLMVLLPLADEDMKWLRLTGQFVEKGIQEYVSELK
mgnify:CR=1 FL=1